MFEICLSPLYWTLLALKKTKWMHSSCHYCMRVNICILFFTKFQFSSLTVKEECLGHKVINTILTLRNSDEVWLQEYQCIDSQFCFDRLINLSLWVWVWSLSIILKKYQLHTSCYFIPFKLLIWFFILFFMTNLCLILLSFFPGVPDS